MSASFDDDDEHGHVSRINEMSEDEINAYLLRTDILALEALMGALIHRWGMRKAVEILHDELADLEVHG